MVLNPCGQNLFKVELIKRVVERALQIPREAKHGRRDRKAYRPRRWASKSYRHGQNY
jgi:hypothetical protein